MKRIVILVLLLSAALLRAQDFSAIQLTDMVYADGINSVQLYSGDYQIGFPVMTLRGGDPLTLTFDDLKGEPRGVYEMRRHLSCYFRGLPDFKDTRIRMVTTLDVSELFSILDEIEERYADL